MGRSRSRSRSSGSGSRLFGRRPSSPQPASAGIAAPPPMPVPRPNVPQVQHNQGGGMMGGILGTVAQGFMFGSGSAVAHRAVDAVAGPRTVEHVYQPGDSNIDTGSAATAAAGSSQGVYIPASQMGAMDASPMAAPVSSSMMNDKSAADICGYEKAQFQRCLQQNEFNVEACRTYMDSLSMCQQSYRSI